MWCKISKFLYPKKAPDPLFQMRYDSLLCSKKLLCETPNWRGMFLRQEGITVLEWCENRSCFSLSGCHLTVSQSWADYHTSFERGDSGLPADLKIKTIGQMIGILWSYFGMLLGWGCYEAQNFNPSLSNLLQYIWVPYIRWEGHT